MHLPMCYTCNSSNRTREARTPDLLRVKQALSQLSYGSVYLPIEPGRFELPISCLQGRRSPGLDYGPEIVPVQAQATPAGVDPAAPQ